MLNLILFFWQLFQLNNGVAIDPVAENSTDNRKVWTLGGFGVIEKSGHWEAFGK